jgi:hypothetical protein
MAAAARKMRLEDAHLADTSRRCFDGRMALSQYHESSEREQELQHEESVSMPSKVSAVVLLPVVSSSVSTIIVTLFLTNAPPCWSNAMINES